MRTPWGHVDFEPTDPTIRALAQHVITASCGGGVFTNDRDVQTCLAEWFKTRIPDIFGTSLLDDAALDSQAHYLCACEGSDTAVAAWGTAVVAEFHSHPQWRTCFEEDLAFTAPFR
jgi:hypothetical protein